MLSRVIPTILLAVGCSSLVWTSGCSQRESFDESLAKRHLAAVCEDLPRNLRILLFRPAALDQSEVWIFVSDSVPTPLGVEDSRRKASFSASSIFSFALASGISEQELPAPLETVGSMLEGAVDGASVRLRSIQVDEGFLCVVERLGN